MRYGSRTFVENCLIGLLHGQSSGPGTTRPDLHTPEVVSEIEEKDQFHLQRPFLFLEGIKGMIDHTTYWKIGHLKRKCILRGWNAGTSYPAAA